LELVSQAYEEQEASIRLNDRATALMSQELTQLNDRLRQEAEKRARASEAYLQAVLQNAADAVISINRDGDIIAFNRAAEKMFGYQLHEILGHPVSALFHQWTPEMERNLRMRLETKSNKSLPMLSAVRGRRRSGEDFPAEISLLRQEME